MTAVATRRRPPVIPEIAKAYQNDPQTALALAAMKTGSSTAPVAQGGYGYADGIARALQGVVGSYVDKRQQKKYTDEEQALLDLRKQRGIDGLTGAAPTIPVVSPPAATAGGQAGAVAAALGAPPPPQAPPPGPPPGPPPMPMAAIPPPVAPGMPPMAPGGPPSSMPPGAPPMAPVMGGGPNGRPPFGQGPAAPNAPSYLKVPISEVVPDAPAPVARPNVPQAVGPTRSKLLDAAYRIMADANPYESAAGQENYTAGLSDQDRLNEAAAQRQQKLIDMGYDTDSRLYADAQNQDRSGLIQERLATQARNERAMELYGNRIFEHGETQGKQTFEHGENTAKLGTEVAVANIHAKSARDVESMKEASDKGTRLTDDAVKFAASQLLSGDPAALNGMTRGKDGQANVTAIRNELTRQAAERGITPTELSSLNARFFGTKSEARAAGTRVGATDVATSEVPALADAAKQAHSALRMQGNLVPLNRAVQMVQAGTSSPELARAVATNGAVTNAYARSFGTGILAQSMQKKAEAQLSVAWGTPAYEAALDQIVQNTRIERTGAKAALDSIGTAGNAAPTPASGGWGKMTVK